jgi:hypothetical protein
MKKKRIVKEKGSKLLTGASIRAMDDPYKYLRRQHDFYSLRQVWQPNSPRSKSGAQLDVSSQSAICAD